MSFIGSWNSFLWPQIVLQDETKYNLPIGLANMVGQPEYQTQLRHPDGRHVPAASCRWHALFFVLQKDFIAGLASGAVKG